MTAIYQLFQKDIYRNINGVIKVGQQQQDSIRQELEEYVITRELNRHFHTFFERYSEALEHPTDKIGVWISGFFGSGKSHFLKILYYLLSNIDAGDRRALDYFDESRISDPVLQANIAKVARSRADVILFNIDSKADANSKNEKDSIVKVFQKVFDDYLGYFGTVPAIAEFERQLDLKGKYDAFKTAFESRTGEKWIEQRDAWAFYQDDIAQALQDSLGISQDAAKRLMDLNEQNYTLSVEQFALKVNQYLDQKGKNHQLLFLVDEVGQYIGENSDLMLNLQTVVEDLGTHCRGRAWVIVTSQEALDEITKHRIKGKDFSKIVGRFGRPLNLSSANTDEVIKLRLLDKTDAAKQSLAALFHQKSAILKNQITFTTDCAELPGYKGEEEFKTAYPFIPYQFNLLQKVFTQIRVMGTAGKHLSEGERSLLDGFQIASKEVSNRELGALVPFHVFYLAIEGFLDGGIRRVIDQAMDNPQLQAFDIDLLKTLFMVKYVKQIRANLENLTTLNLSDIDQDKLALKAEVEASLKRLEKQTLIQRMGDVYSFLTHEEQDIGREIKNIDVEPNEIVSELQKLVWDDIFTEKKFRYDKRHDYGFNRQLDDQTHGQQTHDLSLHLITSYHDRYREYQQNENCLLETASGQSVLVRLPDEQSLLDELSEYLQTSKYLRQKSAGNLTQTVQIILNARSDENSRRQTRIKELLESLIARADVFACSSELKVNRSDPKTVFTEGLKYLVDNVYKKLNYVDSGFDTETEIERAFTREFQEQDTSQNPFNHAAHQEIISWLTEQARTYRKVTIKELIERFNSRPYGWSEFDTLGVMAELVNLGKIELRHAQSTVNFRESGLVKKLRSRQGLNEYSAKLCEVINPACVKIANTLAQDLFEGTPPKDPLKLFEAYRGVFSDQKTELEGWKRQAEADGLPFVLQLQSHIQTLQNLLSFESAAEFYNQIRGQQETLEDFGEDREKLQSFFTRQVKMFQEARRDLQLLEPELRYVEDGELLQSAESVRNILNSSDPTANIPQLPLLLQPIKERVAQLKQEKIQQVQQQAKGVKEKVGQYVVDAHANVAEKLDVDEILQQVERVAEHPISTIDAAIARETELNNLVNSLYQKVDEQAQKVNVEISETRQTAVVYPIVSVKVGTITTKTVLETPEDVDNYLTALRGELLEKINRNYRVRIE